LPAGRWTPREERSSLRPGKRPAALRGEPDNGPLDLGVESALFRAHLQIPNGAEHITLRDADICRDCLHRYHAPCTRFCPASVYAADPQAATAIQIRAENCLQCRCCTLKCPYDNIVWRTPRHGAGPNYANM
ncbi:MAG: 4Fe-4S dicluster domain-containing protein, partial [Kiritimatiellia bacterium]